MDLYFLLPLALTLMMASTGLFMAGLVSPYWFYVYPTGLNTTIHYGLFAICHSQFHPNLCTSWRTYLEAAAVPKWPKQYTSPGGSGASEVFMSMNVLALTESSIVLLWVLCKSFTTFWLRSAYSCAMAALLYGSVGTAVYLGVRFNQEVARKSLGWSAMVVLASVMAEALAALCMQLYLSCGMKMKDESNTPTSILSLSKSTTQQMAHPQSQWCKLMSTARIRKSMSVAKGSSSSRHLKPELLRLINAEQQVERNRHKSAKGWHHFFLGHGFFASGSRSVTRTEQQPAQQMSAASVSALLSSKEHGVSAASVSGLPSSKEHGVSTTSVSGLPSSTEHGVEDAPLANRPSEQFREILEMLGEHITCDPGKRGSWAEELHAPGTDPQSLLDKGVIINSTSAAPRTHLREDNAHSHRKSKSDPSLVL